MISSWMLLNRGRFLALLFGGLLAAPFGFGAEPKAADPARFEKAIAAFEAEDKTNAPPKDATLFYGASNIRLWKSLPQRFGKTKVINRGLDRKSTRLNSSHTDISRMPSSA